MMRFLAVLASAGQIIDCLALASGVHENTIIGPEHTWFWWIGVAGWSSITLRFALARKPL